MGVIDGHISTGMHFKTFNRIRKVIFKMWSLPIFHYKPHSLGQAFGLNGQQSSGFSFKVLRCPCSVLIECKSICF